MSSLLSWLPTVVGVVVVVLVVASIVTLVRHHLHPLQVLSRGVSAGTMLGIVGLAGMLPEWPWWSMWMLAAALVMAIGVACRRLLRESPPEPPTARQARHLAPPTRWNLGGELGVWLAVMVLALSAG